MERGRVRMERESKNEENGERESKNKNGEKEKKSKTGERKSKNWERG